MVHDARWRGRCTACGVGRPSNVQVFPHEMIDSKQKWNNNLMYCDALDNWPVANGQRRLARHRVAFNETFITIYIWLHGTADIPIYMPIDRIVDRFIRRSRT